MTDAPHVTHLSPWGLDWLASLEGGFRLEAYPDSKGIPTISAGLTYYPQSGRRVQLGDTLPLDVARWLFSQAVLHFERGVDAVTPDDLPQCEFDALVAFAYNVGLAAYQGSTLLRLVREDAAFELIRPAFLAWHFAGGQPSNGLLRRRELEAEVYRGGAYMDQSGRAFSVAPVPPVA